jgi:hypothetical protein
MKFHRFTTGLALTALITIGLASTARADFNLTLPEFDGVLEAGPYPLPPLTVGTYTYSIPAGEVITGADISGTFGNSTVPNSAGVDLNLDGLLVGQNVQGGPGYTNQSPTPWSYTFTPADLALLLDGSAEFTATQTSEYVIRLGQTNLNIHTAPATPEPASMALLAGGVLPLLRRRRRPAKVVETV